VDLGAIADWAKAGGRLRMASVALESGVLRYVSETGALLERDGTPVTAPAALPVPECQALTDQLEQLEAQVRDAQARGAGGDHSSGATTELRRGGPVPPKAAHRSGMAGILVLAIGLVLLAFAGGWGENTGADQVKMLTGIAATTVGSFLLAPLCITMLAAVSPRAPIAVRLALRDLARYRATRRSRSFATGPRRSACSSPWACSP
jgi:hypothetical protein